MLRTGFRLEYCDSGIVARGLDGERQQRALQARARTCVQRAERERYESSHQTVGGATLEGMMDGRGEVHENEPWVCARILC